MAKEPLQDIHIDFVFLQTRHLNNGYTYAFVAIDIFSKICYAIPVKNKKPQESIRTIKELSQNYHHYVTIIS